ncbi:MAG: hypothetical protein DWQ51_02720 [Microcystis wesenbergii TW10]|uniref:Uncharacterized protein n=1 Tax=Microcystis wesenbergii TW10 TaxID=2060474 RepID=A0A3E0MBC8_9CHRO|nr:MAG: hypothetical protein DWQ51_02720 [Microcystis wesenbergii TW10]
MLKVVRHPPYQGGQGGSPRLSAPPLSRGAGGIPPPIGTSLIKGGRGDRTQNLFNYNQLLISNLLETTR